MRVIVAGSRGLTDMGALLEAIARSRFRISEVVSGGCKGSPDELGERWARERGVPLRVFPAPWDEVDHPEAVVRSRPDGSRYDAAAGRRRNVQMAEYAEALIALWDGKSRGTAHMIAEARRRGLKVYVHQRHGSRWTGRFYNVAPQPEHFGGGIR